MGFPVQLTNMMETLAEEEEALVKYFYPRAGKFVNVVISKTIDEM